MNRYNMGVPVPILGEFVTRWNRHSLKGSSGVEATRKRRNLPHSCADDKNESIHLDETSMGSHGVFVVFLFIIWHAVGL